MKTPSKTAKFVDSTSTQQSPRHRSNQPAMENQREASIAWTPVYISPRPSTVPKVPLVKNTKYPILLPPMFDDVIEEGDLLGHIPNLQYQDYNLQDTEKFPKFQVDKYLCKKPDLITLIETIVPRDQIEKLAPSGLLNLLKISHFGRSPKLNAVVKILLSCVHEGYLWLDRKIDLNLDVIHKITGLSKASSDPGAHFVGKSLDRKLSVKIMKEHNVTKGTRAYDSANIQDHALRFTVQLLSGRVLRKC